MKGMLWLVGVFKSFFPDLFFDLLDPLFSFLLSLFLFLLLPLFFSLLLRFLLSLFLLFNFLFALSEFTFEPYECIFGLSNLDFLYPVLAHVTHLLSVLHIDFLKLIVLALIKSFKLVLFRLDIQKAKQQPQQHQHLPSRHPHPWDIYPLNQIDRLN